jgi:peptide/nickel transport system substrate-binding protein
VRIASAPQPGYMAVQINVRPGRLFVDVNLRRALQLCIDQPRDVDAATAGGVTPIYGPVMPGTWAYDPTLPRPARNVAAARNLIAGSGWKLGADGIYTKGGVRLAALIVVRGDDQQRVHMADLIAEQARDCGMDLRSESLSWAEIDPGLLTYPHDIPGTHAPFDLYLGNMSANPDPGFDGLNEFVSSSITDAKNPYLNSSTHNNSDWTGFSDPTVDRLAAAALATYDQATRASLYRKAQQEIAAQVPYVFLWADNNYDPVRAAVATVDGPLDLTAPNWAWQPERLVVAATNP